MTSILINVCHVHRCHLFNGSIVTNLFDRVYVYLFQFMAYVRSYNARKQTERDREKKETHFFCSCGDEYNTGKTKTVSQWEFCQTNETYQSFLELSAFLKTLSKFLTFFVAILQQFHLYYRWLPKRINEHSGESHRNKSICLTFIKYNLHGISIIIDAELKRYWFCK